MKLQLKRTYNKQKPGNGGYCIGHLYIDGKYLCDTIEDIDRGLDSSMPLEIIKTKKVYKQTAIPTGTYKVTIDIVSPTFVQKDYYKKYCGGKVPRIQNVKGYEGILMHRGADENSSAGCVIVGYNKVVGKVIDSQKAYELLYTHLKSAKAKGETITIEITRTFKV